jgi:hypothetical protein
MRFTTEHALGWLERRPVLAGVLAYCAITAVAGRHVLAHPSTTIFHDVGDPLLTAALLQWNASTIPFTHAWWQFPIFHPMPDALAFSEHLLGLSVVVTPIEWLLRDPLAAANLGTLLTYPLCGALMLLLVRRLTGSAVAGFLAGLAFAFSPYRAGQLAHVQMLAAFWAPMALLGLHAYLDSGRRRWLVVYALGWLLQALANGYSLFFFSALVGLWVLWFVVAAGRWRALRDVAIATLGAAIPLAPTLATYLAVHARHGFERSAGEAQVFSADLTGLLCAPPETALWGWLQVGCRPESALFPGLVTAVLVGIAVWRLRALEPERRTSSVVRLVRGLLAVAAAIAGLAVLSVAIAGPWRFEVAGLRVSASNIDKPLLIVFVAGLLLLVSSRNVRAAVRQRSTTGFYLGAALIMWLFALGPTVTFMGVARPIPGLYRVLMLLPGGGGLRAPGRFWLMATLCLAVVVGLVASELLARRRPRALLLGALLAVGLIADGWATFPVAPAPVHYPDEEALRGQVVLQLPVGNLQDFAPQFLAVAGGWQSVNGYSGYEPRFYEALRQGSRFEVDSLFEPFRARGDFYVIVNADQPRLRALVERQPGAALVGDRAGVLQYRLPRLPRPAAVHAAAAPVPIVTASGSCAGTESKALDGNLDTRWVCGPQRGQEWFVADLGMPSDNVTAVRYMLGQHYREFPRVLVVDTSLDGVTWDAAWNGDVIAATIEGSLEEPLTAPATVWFPPRRARYIRLRQTGRDEEIHWSLPELAVLAGTGDQSAKAY